MTQEITAEQARLLLPERPADAHKGTFGHLFVIAGSRGFTGAAKLACAAAGRSGVGLVTLGVPAPPCDVVGASLTESMSVPLASTDQATIARAALQPALDFASDKQAVVLGPGLSQHEETRDFVIGFVAQCPVPLLIDADGLNCLSVDPEVLNRRKSPCILTPHPGEMARLVGLTTKDVQADREIIAQDVAARYACTVVLKGNRTVVASESGACHVNTTGNSGLATGGTGDVLAGLVGGLVAQGMSGHEAALLGVYVHGLAGDLAAEAKTQRGLIAGDVIACIPDAWRTLEEASS